ncbi:MAG: protein kinase [Planctomycetes bacterium]|jgi:serine/threonine protein kinase|nr:protein kinase [Planctomycetota bacterium]MBT7012516.1 protein kinase [Planctomycetota bacterium]
MPQESLPKLKRFELLETAGRGNTGTIYRAKVLTASGSLAIGDEVAIKMLHPGLLVDEVAREAFLSEARAGMQVRHPALLRVHAVEEVRRAEGVRLYLVLEYFKGRSIRRWLDSFGLALEPTLRSLARQLSGALCALHESNLVHLDIKPENVLWDDDRALLADLGFVRAATPQSKDEQPLFAGTPAYCAPEVLAGQHPGAAADLFSLGVLLYECATGTRPFGDEAPGIRAARQRALVREPSSIQPRLSAFFDKVVMTLLSENPNDRFASSAELLEVLTTGERGDWWAEHAPIAPRIPLLHRDSLPFAGRDREMDRLEDVFDEVVRTQSPRAFLLQGPTASGKTRLALEFGSVLRRRPDAPPFLYGRCMGAGVATASAFRAVRTALARSLGLAPDEGPNKNVISRLNKELKASDARDLVDILRGIPLPRGTRLQAFRAWFRALGAEGPFVLCLDDLSFVGPGAIQFLADILETEPDLPVLFLLCLRDDLSAESAAAAQALMQFDGCRALPIRDMQRSAIRKIVDLSFADGALEPPLRTDLSRGSLGMPGHLHDLLRYLKSHGEISGRPGDFRPTSDAVMVPSSFSQAELLDDEIATMSETKRAMLQWASLFSPPIRIPLLATALGRAETSVARTIRRLRADGWLRVSNGLYRFARPQLQQVVYATMQDADKRACHRAVFHALEASALDWPGKNSSLAFHASRGALNKTAARLGLLQLERHISHGSLSRAHRVAKRIAPHFEEFGQSILKSHRCRFDVALARLSIHSQNWDEANALLTKAEATADLAQDDGLRAVVAFAYVKLYRATGDGDLAREQLAIARDLTH